MMFSNLFKSLLPGSQPLEGPIGDHEAALMAQQDAQPYQPPVMDGIPSSLQLPPDRLRWLIDDYIVPRMNEVAHEMGWLPGYIPDPNSWIDIRLRNQDSYDNNLEWRKAIGGVFATGNNFTLGSNRRYARLLSARQRADLLGTRPFFGAMTQPHGDAELTRQVEEYLQEEIEQSNVPDTLRDALRVALIRNEAVVKTTYVHRETTFIGPATVMVDPISRPMLTPLKKLYIYENDDFIPDPDTQDLMRLEKDPSFAMQQGQFQYARIKNLPQALTQYSGAYSTVLDTRDFLCPLKVRDIHEADINIHLFHENPDNLRGQFSGLKAADEYYGRRLGFDTGHEAPKVTQGEKNQTHSKVLNQIMIGDVYVRVDNGILMDGRPNGDMRELWVMLDITNADAIFYDYLGNHMSCRPFSVIPGVERVPGRWYGVGVFTKMEHAGLYIDTQFNRVNEKDSQNSSVTFRVPHGVKQWKDGSPVEFGSRKVLDCMPGFDEKNAPIFRKNLQADASLDLNMMDRMQQASDLEFGVISSRDASASDLNQSKTATGVMSIERDANVITADTEYDNAKGIEHVLKLAVEHTLLNMDRIEMRYNPKTSAIVTLNRDEIVNLPRKVKLLLTKTRSSEQLQSNSQAEAVWMRYMKLTPYEQFVGRPFYVKQLKALEIDDVDELLPPVTKQQADAWLQQQAEAAKKPTQPPAKSIATKYTDLARPEQEQVLQQEGITPATPAQIAADDAAKLATKVAEKTAGQNEQPPKPTDESA